jgi:hypothetical protein
MRKIAKIKDIPLGTITFFRVQGKDFWVRFIVSNIIKNEDRIILSRLDSVNSCNFSQFQEALADGRVFEHNSGVTRFPFKQ